MKAKRITTSIATVALGLLLLNTGATSQARRELEIARVRQPREAKIYFALGRAYAALGRHAEAARARAMFAKLNQEKRDEP